MNIGIIGQGFVGNAVRQTMQKTHDVVTYDKKDGELVFLHQPNKQVGQVIHNEWGYMGVIHNTDGPIFLCLPTPMKDDGSCDTSIVRGVLVTMDAIVRTSINSIRDVIIKSTVPPGFTASMNSDCPNLNIFFSPEFLTEAHAVDDFANQTHIILGYPNYYESISRMERVIEMYRESFGKEINLVFLHSTSAEMVKYTTNVFLATKVALANELAQVCDVLGIDWNLVASTASLDNRLGTTHWQVPGPDGHRGFGGSCFPKDVNALGYFAASIGVHPTVMNAVWSKNLEVRPERDWEQLKGRAVIDNSGQ
jgi:UDPglucose 6-dehydrogenase